MATLLIPLLRVLITLFISTLKPPSDFHPNRDPLP